jgi:hypothetical protein
MGCDSNLRNRKSVLCDLTYTFPARSVISISDFEVLSMWVFKSRSDHSIIDSCDSIIGVEARSKTALFMKGCARLKSGQMHENHNPTEPILAPRLEDSSRALRVDARRSHRSVIFRNSGIQARVRAGSDFIVSERISTTFKTPFSLSIAVVRASRSA